MVNDINSIIKILKEHRDEKSIEGMARQGITPGHALGVKIPVLRQLAKDLGRNHNLALALWQHDLRETRILAAMVAEPKKANQMLIDEWVKEFTYWEICDQCVMNLFEKLPFIWETALVYAKSEDEFTKRTGFVIMARLAVSDKKADDNRFLQYLLLIESEAWDNRNMVKKAVNWALRQIGKRSKYLNKAALETAYKISQQEYKSAKWIAADAIRELESPAVQKRLK